jgi:hypothetical protein
MNTHRAAMLILLLVIISFHEAAAIPAFARKYNMSCTTCHQPAPKLKPYGDEFAGNGFQMPDQEAPRAFRETGDEDLLLMREIPLALRFEGYARWLHPQTNTHGSDFQWPYLIKLLSGGQITRDVSYYFYFFFGERGEVTGLEDAFIMFNKLFHTELDLYLGQFQVSDPLFKRELRLTLEDYQIYRVKPGHSSVNLTYDRGVMLTYGFPTGTDIVFEVLNGSGIGPADPERYFDTDKYKNLALRVSQDIGQALRIGGFGYYGKEDPGGVVNTMWMAGPDITLSLAPVELNIQYIERQDDNPTFVSTPSKTATRGAFAELVYIPDGDKGKWYGAALYNWVYSDESSLKYHAMTGHVGYLLARNFRLVGEYTYDLEAKANRYTIGFVSAF